MYELSFHHLLSFLIDFANSWAPRQIWNVLYAHMGDLLRFSKPAFDQIRMESLCIRISHVIFIVAAYDFTGLAIVHLFNTD